MVVAVYPIKRNLSIRRYWVGGRCMAVNTMATYIHTYLCLSALSVSDERGSFMGRP